LDIRSLQISIMQNLFPINLNNFSGIKKGHPIG